MVFWTFARISALVLVCSVVGCAANADGMISIPTRTMTDSDFLQGHTDAGQPVVVTARLTGLKEGTDRPVVILLHGSNGPKSGAVWNWSQFLNAHGVATLRIDDYTARNIGNVSTDQDAAAQFMPILDTYRSVEVLADIPEIDPDHIYVMGFSRGGTAALYASLERFQSAFGPLKGHIAGYFPFYPACNFTLEDELEVVDQPIHVFHGEADDWTPIAPCRDYLARLKAAGKDAAITEYPGAHHAFDDPASPSLFSDPAWKTSRACHRIERNGTLVNEATGKPFTYDDACVEKAPHASFNGPAMDAAQREILELLAE